MSKRDDESRAAMRQEIIHAGYRGELYLPDDQARDAQRAGRIDDFRLAQAYRSEAIRLREEAEEREAELHRERARVKTLERQLLSSDEERQAELLKVIAGKDLAINRLTRKLASANSRTQHFERIHAEMQAVYDALVTSGSAPELRLECSHGNPANRCIRCLALAVRRENRTGSE